MPTCFLPRSIGSRSQMMEPRLILLWVGGAVEINLKVLKGILPGPGQTSFKDTRGPKQDRERRDGASCGPRGAGEPRATKEGRSLAAWDLTKRAGAARARAPGTPPSRGIKPRSKFSSNPARRAGAAPGNLSLFLSRVSHGGALRARGVLVLASTRPG